jgi:hypothetical protein
MSDLTVWFTAFEQEISEIAARIESVKMRLQLSTRAELNDSSKIKSLTTSLHREVANLRGLGQRADFKNKQLSKLSKATGQADNSGD